MLSVFPLPVIGIDSADGGEFINNQLFDFCQDQRITFTRSRPYNKNDGAHAEQKNWSGVRELVGYLRCDTPAELELLNQIWELDRISPTICCPSKNSCPRSVWEPKSARDMTPRLLRTGARPLLPMSHQWP